MDTDSLYDEFADVYDAWVGAELRDPILDELISIGKSERVCAVACGAGREARYLARRSAIVSGIDLSSKLINLAVERELKEPLGIEYEIGSAHDLAPFGDSTFAGVLCHMALMDIPDLDMAFASIARILQPGGWFVFSITHPCFKTPAYGKIVDHVDGSVRRTLGRYFDEGAWEGPGVRTGNIPARAYHRTLSTYLNALVEYGFDISQVREPKLDTPVWQQAACILYVKCAKR